MRAGMESKMISNRSHGEVVRLDDIMQRIQSRTTIMRFKIFMISYIHITKLLANDLSTRFVCKGLIII